MKALFAVIGIGLWMFLGAIARGYVFTKLWAWFMVTQFALPAISIPGGIGLAVVVGMLTHQIQKGDPDKLKGAAIITTVVMTFAWPAVFLFEGWIIKLFM